MAGRGGGATAPAGGAGYRGGVARSLRALRWLLLAAAAVLLVVTTGEFLVALVGRKAAQAVDLIPLWCRARALAGSPGGCDPAVMAEVFHHPVAPAPGVFQIFVFRSARARTRS